MNEERCNVADVSGVRVMRERCPTCIFRPGNLMQLQPGRVRDMVDEVRWTEGCIPCHETLEDDVQAVCRGQFEAAPTQPLQIAARLGYVVAWDRPEKDLGHEWDTRPDLFAAGGRA